MTFNGSEVTSFAGCELFYGVPPEELAHVIRMFERKTVPPNTVICRQGDPGNALFVIEQGMAQAFTHTQTGAMTVLESLGAGAVFGEMAIVTGDPRTASVRSVLPTTILIASRDQFLSASSTMPVLLYNLSRILGRRLARATRNLAEERGPQVVAVIGRVPPRVGSLVSTNLAAALSATVSSPNATTRQRVLLVDRPPDQASALPGREGTPALTDIWSAQGTRLNIPVFRFGASRFMALNLPADGGLLNGIRPRSLTEALDWFRGNARYTILNLAMEDRADILAIVPHVDRTYLLVTTAQLATTFADELVSAFNTLHPEARERSHVVVLSDEGLPLAELRGRSIERLGVPARITLPGPAQMLRDAARFPAPLAIEAPYLSFSRAMYWLARDVAHLKVGVALGSGGARGFAHVGALRFLEDHHIPNDFLAGTSMGSVIGAPRALGMDTVQGRETMLMLHDKFTNMLKLRWGLHMLHAIFTPDAIEAVIRELVGDATFEELPVPFAVVASDLDRARPVVFTRGVVSDALRASSSVPVFLPPKVIGNMRLVDGAVLNPVPTQAVRDLGADIVIAVDLSIDSETPDAERQNQPNVPRMILRCFEIMTAERAVRDCELADVVIHPKFEVTGWQSFDQAEVYEQAGYLAAEQVLPDLQKLLPWVDRGR
ncbi:MAG: cyclic nucleotide-binding domain-containing protein [Chloroflexota bacterium]